MQKVANGWDSDLAALAKFALAQLDRDIGKNDDAVDLYNQLIAKPSNTVPVGTAQLQLADLYQAEGKTDQAKKLLAEIKDKDAEGSCSRSCGREAESDARRPACNAASAIAVRRRAHSVSGVRSSVD